MFDNFRVWAIYFLFFNYPFVSYFLWFGKQTKHAQHVYINQIEHSIMTESDASVVHSEIITRKKSPHKKSIIFLPLCDRIERNQQQTSPTNTEWKYNGFTTLLLFMSNLA